MPYILAGFFVVWLALYGARGFLRANPAVVAHFLNWGSGVLALGLALLLLLRGRLDIAIGLGLLGFWLLATAKRSAAIKSSAKAASVASRRKSVPRPSGISHMRSAVVEMEFDHATGVISGTVLAGPEEGASLDRLSRAQCEALYSLCLRDDQEGARFLEAYLDRRFPGWRAARDREFDAWGRRPAAAPGPGGMTEDEAYEVLGLQKGATRDDVMRSHRSLIKKLHPDQGGSTDLAARVNEAKDVLMRRHH
ncbi:MAG: DnaJ domain-containing protein [Methylovirgula sp.]